MEEFGIGWAFGGIALTAAVTTLGTWFVTRYQLKQQAETDKTTRHEEMERDGRYIAVRVVCVLDPFVLECCDIIADDGSWAEDGRRHTTIDIPKLAYPEDVDWRNMKPNLMYRILTLPNELENACRSISAADEHSGPPDHEGYFEERRYQFANLGLTAIDLARDIRDAYGLAQPDYRRWNPRTALTQAFAAEDEQRQRAAEMSQKLMDAYYSKQETPSTTSISPDKPEK